MRKTARLIHSYYRLIIIIFLVLTFVSVAMIFNMKITTDIIDVLPANSKAVIQFKEFIEKFSTLENLTVLIEFDKKPIDEQVEIIESIAKKINESPLIEYADYNALSFKSDLFIKHFPFYLDEKGLRQFRARLTSSGIEHQVRQNRRRLLSPFSSPLDNELIIKDPLNISSIVKSSLMRIYGERTIDASTGYYITKDNKMAFIFAKPRGKSKDMAFVKKIKTEMDSAIKAVLREKDNPAGISIRLAGTYILAEEAREAIQSDIITSSALSVILIAFLIWIVYRVNAATLASIGFTLLSSLAMTLSVAYLMFGSLNIITSIVAAVLIGLYVDYSIHIINRYADEFKKNKDSMTAAEITLVRVGPAIIISGATTSLSFFSILVTNFKGLYELGITSGIGVMLCLFSAIFLLPSLLIWISNRSPDMAIPEKKTLAGIETLATLIINRPRQIFIISLIVIILAALGISRVNFDNNPQHIGLKHSKSMTTLKAIASEIGQKGEPLIISASAKDNRELAAAFDALEQTINRWKTNGMIKTYDSLGIFLPSPSYQKIVLNELADIKKTIRTDDIKETVARSMEKNGMVPDAYVSSYINGIINAVSVNEAIGFDQLEVSADPRLRHFYNKGTLSIAAYIYPKGDGWDKQATDTLKQDIAEQVQYKPSLIGMPILFEEIKASIMRGSALAILITLFLNIIVVYLHFKKIRQTLLVMLPVVLGLLMTIGIMGHIGQAFNFINIGIVALIFGLGVDYGIYIMQAYTKDSEKDIGNALQLTGKNIMMCAATTVAGCGSLITAQFAGIASIGVVLSIGAFSCAFISLVMMPSIIQLSSKKTHYERF